MATIHAPTAPAVETHRPVEIRPVADDLPRRGRRRLARQPRRLLRQPASSSPFPGSSPAPTSSPSRAAASSGRSSITRPTPSGACSSAGSWRISAACIPFFFLLFLPLIPFCAPQLWHWWNPESLRRLTQFLLEEKSGYLNHTFFSVRYIVYFVGLGGVIYLLRRWSIAQDRDGAQPLLALDAPPRRRRAHRLRRLPHLRRRRLADGAELPLVLHHVGRLHLRRHGGLGDVAPRDHRHRPARRRAI